MHNRIYVVCQMDDAFSLCQLPVIITVVCVLCTQGSRESPLASSSPWQVSRKPVPRLDTINAFVTLFFRNHAGVFTRSVCFKIPI